MATVLSGVSDLKAFLTNWSNASHEWTYGAFWNSSVGLLYEVADVAADPTTPFTQWGNGDLAGGDGVLLETDSSFQYANGNLTGEVNTLTFGSGFAASSAAGILLANDSLTLDLDQSFNYNGPGTDAFDLAIFGITGQNSLNGLYNYLAATGTVIEDTSNDTLVGFAGEDVFVFSGGQDIIANDGPTGTYGYQDGTDTLDVSGWGVTDFDDLSIADISGDAYVAYGTNHVQLVGCNSSVLDPNDFVFASAALVA